ncbi:MAG: ABC transporter ATP-binding protein [Gemmatimonadetes bacterium]|nr:ABC transporter ATP-binding protein [Gemmatimonadota bacterium]
MIRTALGADGSAPVLAVNRLTKRYSRAAPPAVADVELTVAHGEIVAIVGESGCGKSTLLRLIAGLENPDAGEIRIGGRVVSDERTWAAPEHRGVGMVFQDFALFPHMTVVGNITFGLASLPRAQRRARAEAMLEMVDLAGYGDRYPHQLSGDQQQRVALARALGSEPALLLLDEPFSNLDTTLKRTLREEMREILQRTGTTTLLVVHDAEDVLALADRAAVMRAGRILQEGDADTLYRNPCNEYVARFFGETNVLPAQPCEGGFQTSLGIVACAGAANCPGAVQLCLRPEHLQIVSGAAGRPAVVDRVHTVGMRRRVVVRLDDGSPGETLVVHTGTESHLVPGDRIRILPRAECAHVMSSD